MLSIFVFFAVGFAIFGYLLATDAALPQGFRGVMVGVVVLCGLYLVIAPLSFARSRRAMLRVTDDLLSVDTAFGSRSMPIASITNLKVVGAGRQRALVATGAGKTIAVNQMMLPDPAAFEAVLRTLQQRLGGDGR